MPKISVYLPDDLYREARDMELPISALAQEAIRSALVRTRNTHWIARARARNADGPRIDTSALLDEVRGDFEE
jgi:post-segregation antitoxin (ccd killing protein)